VILAAILLFFSVLLALAIYSVKRHFDDRAAARDAVCGISESLEERLCECIVAVQENTGLVRERLTVFEKALANAIGQFAEIVKETRASELESRAKTAGSGIRLGRRMPTP
jgi:hypothetical protein